MCKVEVLSDDKTAGVICPLPVVFVLIRAGFFIPELKKWVLEAFRLLACMLNYRAYKRLLIINPKSAVYVIYPAVPFSMKKTALLLLAILTLYSCSRTKNEKGKILIIVSNTEDMGDPEKHFAGNNLWEVAPPYHIFVSHRYQVDFASPTGGEVPFSMDPLGISSYTIKYEGFMDKANNSLRPDKIVSEDYEAVFIGGGYGPLFDVAQNEKLMSVIAEVYERGGIVGGCGHGPGGFANVKLSDGEFMVKGKKVAGFPDETEVTKDWAKNGTLLPFMAEGQLRRNGAIFQGKDDLADKHDVVTDQRIVSTMFLPSAAIVAKEMIIALEDKGN